MGRLEGKSALITGAASGIGAATARRFVEEGASVLLADIQTDKGEEIAATLGGGARFFRCDVTLEEDVSAAVDHTVSSFGKLDILVNNAGIVGAVGPIADTPAAAWRKTIDVLLNAVFYGIKHAARAMTPHREGCILSTASTAGVTGGLGPHAYTAAKFGVVGLTRSVASELAKHGVRVNTVAPGTVATELILHLRPEQTSSMDAVKERISRSSPLGLAGDAVDVANAMLFLASEEARYITGHTLLVDAGITSFGATPTSLHSQDSELIREAGRRGF
jgi:NAD(P)-dependent dehydrogenase (short-subunit alcohol dehydrogenase family)